MGEISHPKKVKNRYQNLNGCLVDPSCNEIGKDRKASAYPGSNSLDDLLKGEHILAAKRITGTVYTCSHGTKWIVTKGYNSSWVRARWFDRFKGIKQITPKEIKNKKAEIAREEMEESEKENDC